jgi:GcrA cell cycle regulator
MRPDAPLPAEPLVVAAPLPELPPDLAEPGPCVVEPPAEPCANRAESAPEPPPAELLTTAEKVAGLTSGTCHWPHGDPASPEFRFCGGSVTVPPYCAQHHALAYLSPVEVRRMRRRQRSARGVAYTSARALAWAG